MGKEQETIIITSTRLTRELLKDGERIVDIKPHKTVKNASVFIFESSENIKKKLEKRREQSR